MIKYKDGDRIGPYNILLVKRTVKKNNRWRGIFICPRCGKEFETAIGYIAYGQTISCGCVGGTKNLIGKKFGKLTAMYPTDKRASGHIVWHCICDCGQEKDVSAHHLMDGNVQSCGCSASKNLIGEKFGYLKVVDKMDCIDKKTNCRLWKCKCSCGNYIILPTRDLTSRRVRSCGCINSLGEKTIVDILTTANINFIKQKTFSDCINPKTKYLLRFDFFIPEINLCIEYNGIQHYMNPNNPQGFFTTADIIEMKKRDLIKIQYCHNTHIPLLIIPYWQFNNLEAILLDTINYYREEGSA